MAREREYQSPAERQRAYRQRQAEQNGDLDELEPGLEIPEPPPIAGTREEAIARGHAYGADEANKRREDGHQAQQRIARAEAYAAWEYDGRQLGVWADYCEEFGIVLGAPVMDSLQRPESK